MPGSKTYTSNKANELLEIDVVESTQAIESCRKNTLIATIVGEVLKICGSLLASAIFTKEKNMLIDIDSLIKFAIFFIASYLLFSGICILGIFLFDLLFNKRRIRYIQDKAYLLYHKKFSNNLYLAIGFENKCSAYFHEKISNASCPRSIDIDLAINYLFQSVFYLKKSSQDLASIIPTFTPSNREPSNRDRVNANFLNMIGYPALLINLPSAIHTIIRIQAIIPAIQEVLKNKEPKFNDYSQYYLDAISELSQSVSNVHRQYINDLNTVISLKSIWTQTNNK